MEQKCVNTVFVSCRVAQYGWLHTPVPKVSILTTGCIKKQAIELWNVIKHPKYFVYRISSLSLVLCKHISIIILLLVWSSVNTFFRCGPLQTFLTIILHVWSSANTFHCMSYSSFQYIHEDGSKYIQNNSNLCMHVKMKIAGKFSYTVTWTLNMMAR